MKSVFGEALRLNWCSFFFFSDLLKCKSVSLSSLVGAGMAMVLPKETQLGYGFHARFTSFSSLGPPLKLTCLIPGQVPACEK